MQCLNCKKLKSDYNNISEFQDIFDDVGIELQLAQLLGQYFQLQVRKEDDNQQLLCQACVEKLMHLLDVDECENEQRQQIQSNSNDDLLVEIEEIYSENLQNKEDDIIIEDNNDYDDEFESEILLLESVQYVNNLDETTKNTMLIEYHESAEENAKKSSQNVAKSKVYNCDVCYLTFRSSVNCSLHRNMHALPVDVQVYVCTECGILAHEWDDTTPETWICSCAAEIEQEIVSCAYCCEYCGKNYNIPQKLMAHRATNVHSDQMFVCEICKEKFSKLPELREHLKLHNNYEALMQFPLHRLFLCSITNCEETFTTWTMLHKHKLKEHAYRVCVNCQQLFSREQLAQHKAICQTETFSCQYCNKAYKSKMSRSVHIRRSHTNKYNCKYCTAAFNKQSLLLTHVDYLHVPIKCDKCHKIMKNRRNFLTHDRAVHQHVQRYPCRQEGCKKAYYYLNERNAHEKAVHADIVYKCTECDFSTKYAQSLELHIAKHKNQLPFMCTICDKSFARKQVLSIHILRHRAEKPYKCSERLENACRESFYSNYLLNKHIQKCHTASSGRQVNKSKTRKKITQNENSNTTESMADQDMGGGILAR